jgi:hypothetical protein
MNFLLFIATTIFSFTIVTADHVGTYKYAIETPNGPVSGEMKLEKKDGAYKGTITAYGQEFEMTEIEVNGASLSFKTNVQGMTSTIKGNIENDVYSAIIFVEGLQIPLKAEKVK